MVVSGQLLYRAARYERQGSPCPPRAKPLLYLAFHSKELAEKTREKPQTYSHVSIPSSILTLFFSAVFYLFLFT